jgi:hypothetical protein
MPTYRGNRSNLLQHWVLTELVGCIRGLEIEKLCFVVLRATTNRLADLLPHVPRLRAVLETAQPGQVYEIS